ncbi:type III pantothenate kinase [Sunxiuqinia sp. A32]|uniref:type III pantothenate kinase n=1 Tax=Sunxiuqinia sp. A32 TaxID=3461496 RepID=UPI0040467D0D
MVANAIAAQAKCKGNCMVIDFGTALTFTTISEEGEILGVAIAPGLRTAIKSLAGDTAQLPHVKLETPPSVLGKNTVHAIQSGVIVGFTGLVEHIIVQTEKTLNSNITVIATGGLSASIAEQTNKIHRLEKNLTLDGLKIIGEICFG